MRNLYLKSHYGIKQITGMSHVYFYKIKQYRMFLEFEKIAAFKMAFCN